MSEYNDLFSVDGINEVNGHESKKSVYIKKLTFPADKKAILVPYFKKNIDKIVENLIRDAEKAERKNHD